jgi:hypothetical protein
MHIVVPLVFTAISRTKKKKQKEKRGLCAQGGFRQTAAANEPKTKTGEPGNIGA